MDGPPRLPTSSSRPKSQVEVTSGTGNAVKTALRLNADMDVRDTILQDKVSLPC